MSIDIDEMVCAFSRCLKNNVNIYNQISCFDGYFYIRQ